jgi:hypothetical protein
MPLEESLEDSLQAALSFGFGSVEESPVAAGFPHDCHAVAGDPRGLAPGELNMPATRNLNIWSPDFDPAETEASEDLLVRSAGDAVAEHCKKVAASIWPNGTTIYCGRCKHSRPATVQEMARFLDYRVEMPTCCQQTMRIGDPPSN